MKEVTYRPLWFLFGLFLIALTIRAIYFIELSNLPYFSIILPVYDHFNFDQGALSFAGGDLLARSPNNSYSPLYKYFLGSIYFIFGRNFYAVYSIQFALGAAGAVLLYLIGKKLFDARVGLFAFSGFSLYSTEIIYEGIILRAAFITFLGISSFYLLIRLRETPSFLRLTGCALVLSLFLQSRPNTFLCLPFVLFYIHKYVFADWNFATRLRGWAFFLTLLSLSFIPLLLQCYLVHGRFVFFDSSGPIAFLAGNFIEYSGVGFDFNLLEQFQNKYRMKNLSPVAFIFQQIFDDPLGFFRMIWRKIFFFFNDLEGASNLSVYLYLESSKILPHLISHFSFISALGIIGIVLAIRNKENIFLLYAFLGSLILSVVLFHVVARFRVPSVPFLILFSAYALGKTCAWWQQRKWKSLALFMVILLTLFYGLRAPTNQIKIRYVDDCNWSYSYMLEEKWFDLDKAETYGMRCLDSERKINSGWGTPNTSLASIYKLYGSYLIQQKDKAVEQVLKYTFSINPFDAEIYRMYSDSELSRGNMQSAIRYLQISLIARRNDRASLRSLIQLYYKKGGHPSLLLKALQLILSKEKDPVIIQKVKDEIGRLEGLVDRKSVYRGSFLNNARKYLANGKWSEAIEEYKKLNVYNASSPEFFVEQGVAYENLGDQENALRSYYDALLIDENNPQLNKNLGNYYLSINNLVFVILHWKKYLETAPKDREYILTKKRYQFFSQQLRMKNLEKQIFGLSEEQTREIFKIYRNMNVKLS